MTIAQALPQILEHVDIDRWERPASLLRVIAALQDGPNPVPLGLKMLQALGRTERQAKYDHQVLVRLAARDRVLIRFRGSGRAPDCWAIAGLERWRHVPWITPRRDVIAAFLSPLPDEAVALWSKRAAQAVALGTDTPILEALSAAGLSVKYRSTTPRHRSTTPPDAGGTPPGYVHYATAPAAPYCSSDSDLTPSLPPQEDPNQGVRESEQATKAEDPGEKLLAVVRSTVKTKVLGTNADRIRAVGRAHAEHLDALIADVGGFFWIKTGTGAAQAVEDSAASLAYVGTFLQAADTSEARAAGLRQQIANYRAFGAEPEIIEGLERQLAVLGAGYDDPDA